VKHPNEVGCGTNAILIPTKPHPKPFKSTIINITMFGNKCSNCNTRVRKDFEFCPSCGSDLNSNFEKEDFGFLGRNDSVEEPIQDSFPNFSDSFMDKMFSTAMKMLENQMRNLNEEVARNPNHPMNPRNKRHRQNLPNDLNIQFFVNGKKVFNNPNNQHLNNQNNQQQTQAQVNQIRIDPKVFTDKLKKSSKLPKKEPQSKLKRISNKIVYELHVPGVKSVEDILINQLENSIEIKALSNKHLYSKSLNLNLPILRYKLKNDFLTIELQG
jgi:hypothetical protein|tara:strand:+ start:118 stop:927 length:810 start_codon:yes stop_codon:yes gene_type:complete